MGSAPSRMSAPRLANDLPAAAKATDDKGLEPSQETVASVADVAATATAAATLEAIRKQLRELREQSQRQIEPTEERVERYIEKLHVPLDHLRRMVDSFVHELEVGLLVHREHPYDWDPKACSFKMLDACVPQLPDGKEKGTFYALDFGGTNFRVVRSELMGDGTMNVTKSQKSVVDGASDYPRGLMDPRATAMQMFDYFASTVKDFVQAEGDSGGVSAGFTFSFPCSQRSIDQALLISWTKGFETGRQTDDPVEGLDVVELMNVAFHRNNVAANCTCVLNDTVGTLLSCAYSMDHATHPPCVIGLILGTGMNCCYYEETAPQFGYKGKIINVECGNFNRDLPRLNVDCELDFKAVDNRGFQQIEKMCSGAYLGEICRLALVRILAEQTPSLAWRAFSLSTEKLAQIVNDRSKELIVTYKIMAGLWHVEMPLQHLRIVHRVATAVMDRAAALAAVLIAGCARKSGRLQPAFGGLSVGIDGSLYKNNPWYRERLRYHLNAILGDHLGNFIHLLTADDGSGKGAAILAATLSNCRTRDGDRFF